MPPLKMNAPFAGSGRPLYTVSWQLGPEWKQLAANLDEDHVNAVFGAHLDTVTYNVMDDLLHEIREELAGHRYTGSLSQAIAWKWGPAHGISRLRNVLWGSAFAHSDYAELGISDVPAMPPEYGRAPFVYASPLDRGGRPAGFIRTAKGGYVPRMSAITQKRIMRWAMYQLGLSRMRDLRAVVWSIAAKGTRAYYVLTDPIQGAEAKLNAALGDVAEDIVFELDIHGGAGSIATTSHIFQVRRP
jgi:hypothetical protein